MDDSDSEILIETLRIGGAMEVRAISASDGLEIVFSAPASASQDDITKLARSKLAYVRAKMKTTEEDAKSKHDAKGGRLV